MASYKGRKMLHGINQQHTTNTVMNAWPSPFVELTSVVMFLEHGSSKDNIYLRDS